jgi:D-alanyl-D-alanine-carboxypeptidase/D-alanyl-D-alanine-endopeptidase
MKVVIDRLVAPILAVRSRIALAVGVVEQGRRSVHAYGQIAGAETLFEVGSITKVFTATLLASLVEEGRVRLDEPVRAILPELTDLPEGITLLRLATHTSGLPRIPLNMRASMVKNVDNPYAAYTVHDLFTYLASYHHPPADDEPFAYSNLGAGLLGHALARRAGAPYEAAVVQRICDPLKLTDTRITLDIGQRARLAEPRSAHDGKASAWDFAALPGCGALRSTAHDMLTFLAANLGRGGGSLASALRACQAVKVTVAPPRGGSPPPGFLHMALGWMVSRLGSGELPVFWHNGGTGGYRSFAGFVKERGVGVVVLSNVGTSTYDLSIDALGMGLLQILAAKGDPPPRPPRSNEGLTS